MPELGKATYVVELNTAQIDSGLSRLQARVTAATNGIAKNFERADEAVASLGPTTQTTAGEVDVAAGQMSLSFEEVGAAAVDAGAEAQAGAGLIGGAAAEAAGESEAGAARTVSAWKRAGAAMTGIGTKLRSVGRTMTHNFTLPIVAAFGIGAKMSLDFDEQMRLVQTQAGATGAEVVRMTRKVMDYAKSGKSIASANDLAKALFHIESVGFRGAKAMDVLKLAQQGAMVGAGNLEAVTNGLVGAMKTQIAGTETAASTMGILNAAIGRGNLRMDDLTSALGTGLANAAKNAGISLGDVLSGLDVMTQQGIPAVNAATALTMSLKMIQAPSGKAKAALKELSLGPVELARTMAGPGGFVAMIDLLRARLDGIKDPIERNRIIIDIFSRRASKAMLTLLNGTKDLHRASDEIKAASGSFPDLVKKAQLERINQLRAAWTQVKASLIELGAAVAPSLVSIAHGIVSVVQAFDKLSPGVKRAIVVGLLLTAALGPLLSLTSALIAPIATLASTLGMLSLAASAAGVSMGALILPVLPWVALGAAIAAVVTAMVAAVVAPRQLQAALEKLGVSAGWAAGVVKGLQVAFKVTVTYLRGVFNVMVADARLAFGIIKGWLDIIIGVLTLDWRRAWTGMKEVVSAELNFIKSIVGNFVTTVKNTLGALLDPFKKKILGVVLTIVRALDVTVLGRHIVPGVHSLVKKIEGELNKLKGKELAKRVADGYYDVFVPGFHVAGTDGREALEAELAKVNGANAARTAVENIKPKFTAVGASAGAAARSGIESGIEGVDPKVGGATTKLGRKFATAGATVGDLFGQNLVKAMDPWFLLMATHAETIFDQILASWDKSTRDFVSNWNQLVVNTAHMTARQFIYIGGKWRDQSGKVVKDAATLQAILKKMGGPVVPKPGTVITLPPLKPAVTLPPVTKPPGTKPPGKKLGKKAEEDLFGKGWTELQIRQARAEGTKRLSDDRKIYLEEIKYLNALMARLKAHHKLTLDAKLQIVQAIESAKASLRDVNERLKGAVTGLTELVFWTPKMRIRVSLAERTKGLRDDIAAQQAELVYLRKLLDHLPKTKKYLEQRATLIEEITSVLARIKDLKREQAETQEGLNKENRRLMRAYLDERASFFSSFGPSVFTQSAPRGGSTQPTRTPGSGAVGIGMARGGVVPRYATGGPVRGTDTVPALLTPGEVVLNWNQIRRLARTLGVGGDPLNLFKAIKRLGLGTTRLAPGALTAPRRSPRLAPGVLTAPGRVRSDNGGSRLAPGALTASGRSSFAESETERGGGHRTGGGGGIIRINAGVANIFTRRVNEERESPAVHPVMTPARTEALALGRRQLLLPERQTRETAAIADRDPAVTHVNVTQHFGEATTDKYREAMYAEIAFRHRFDSGSAY